MQVDSEERGAGPHSRECGRKTPREAEHQTENPRCITATKRAHVLLARSHFGSREWWVGNL